MKGRPRIPTEVKLRNGSPSHVPIPEPVLVGGRIAEEDLKDLKPPAGLSMAEKRAWWEIVRPLVHGQILDRADLPLIELAAQALNRCRVARVILAKEGITHIGSQGRSAHPAIAIEKGAMAEYRGLAAMIGQGATIRPKLGKTAAAQPEGGMSGELARQLPPRAGLRVVGGDDI